MAILSQGNTPAVSRRSTDTLNQNELGMLLKVLHECRFDGKDVLLLAAVVEKLKNQLESK